MDIQFISSKVSQQRLEFKINGKEVRILLTRDSVASRSWYLTIPTINTPLTAADLVKIIGLVYDEVLDNDDHIELKLNPNGEIVYIHDKDEILDKILNNVYVELFDDE